MAQRPLSMMARAFTVGAALLAIALFATNSFRVAGSLILADLAVLLAWRLTRPADAKGWYVVRSKRVDGALIAVLLVGMAVFTFWVPNS